MISRERHFPLCRGRGGEAEFRVENQVTRPITPDASYFAGGKNPDEPRGHTILFLSRSLLAMAGLTSMRQASEIHFLKPGTPLKNDARLRNGLLSPFLYIHIRCLVKENEVLISEKSCIQVSFSQELSDLEYFVLLGSETKFAQFFVPGKGKLCRPCCFCFAAVAQFRTLKKSRESFLSPRIIRQYTWKNK